MKLRRAVGKALDGAIDLSAILAGLLIVAVVVSITYEIVLRSVFGRSSNWTIEATSYSLLYMTFLATPWVLRREGHVSMDMVIRRLNPRDQRLVNCITSLLGAVACMAITWFSFSTTLESLRLHNFLNTELRPPQFIILMVIPFGSFLLFVQFVRRGCQMFGAWKELSSSAGRMGNEPSRGGDRPWIGP